MIIFAYTIEIKNRKVSFYDVALLSFKFPRFKVKKKNSVPGSGLTLLEGLRLCDDIGDHMGLGTNTCEALISLRGSLW